MFFVPLSPVVQLLPLVVGENVVRGDKDSIRNLLEIFDGLLEYLTEQLSDEELQNGGEMLPPPVLFLVVLCSDDVICNSECVRFDLWCVLSF